MPIFLWFILKPIYLWWIRWEVWYPKHKWLVLEIKPPKEILKPFKAMENVFSSLWGILDTPSWREFWCEGEFPFGGGLWFSFEVVSIGGNIHFYMRVPEGFRYTAESAIHAQYPDAEISVVEDYTKKVPQDLPNKDWDIYGEEFTFLKDHPYPIKTYDKFFEEKPEASKEEKRIDPMDALLEGLSKVTPDEQVWLQIVCTPVTDNLFPWITRGNQIKDEIIKRSKPAKPKPMIQEAAEIIAIGPQEEKVEQKKEDPSPIEFKLTPGERDVLTAIEGKMKKQAFSTWIRSIHIYKADKQHLKGKQAIIRSYFQQFMTGDLNSIVFLGRTRARIQYLFKKRRLFMRKRRQFRNYVERFPPFYPRLTGEPVRFLGLELLGEPPGPGIGKGTIILNTEELATIFHFPARVVIPGVPYVEAKKVGPPPELPTE